MGFSSGNNPDLVVGDDIQSHKMQRKLQKLALYLSHYCECYAPGAELLKMSMLTSFVIY